MGKYDCAFYEYLNNNERFADLFNAGMFHGEPIISGNMLQECDGRYVTSERSSEQSGKDNSRYRDIKKQLKNGNWLVVTAVENQECVDYSMPLRMMQYDFLEYEKQRKQIQNAKEQSVLEQGRKVTAYNINMGPDDRLNPVYSICFYHGVEEWKGPICLKDMMNFQGAQPEWEQCFHDYGMKQDNFRHLDIATAEMIAVLTDRQELLENINRNEEEYDMCQAMDELEQEWFLDGMEQGIEQGIEQATTRMLRLVAKLKEQGELHLVEKMVEDRELLQKLCVKYGI